MLNGKDQKVVLTKKLNLINNNKELLLKHQKVIFSARLNN